MARIRETIRYESGTDQLHNAASSNTIVWWLDRADSAFSGHICSYFLPAIALQIAQDNKRHRLESTIVNRKSVWRFAWKVENR
jgi:hypothetical protein